MTEIIRVPVMVPAWVVDALRARSAQTGRALADEALVVLIDALPRVAADAVTEWLRESSVPARRYERSGKDAWREEPGSELADRAMVRSLSATKKTAPGEGQRLSAKLALDYTSLPVILPSSNSARSDHRDAP
ncbi:MAG TPA: hypothetical protein VK217_08500 [Acidimicrobiales bacterium]|nr:hypothetical protein [Acidimicrobiales bacterium]